jgi:hypothetical protein
VHTFEVDGRSEQMHQPPVSGAPRAGPCRDADLLVLEHLVHRVDRPAGHAAGVERLDPVLRAWACGSPRGSPRGSHPCARGGCPASPIRALGPFRVAEVSAQPRPQARAGRAERDVAVLVETRRWGSRSDVRCPRGCGTSLSTSQRAAWKSIMNSRLSIRLVCTQRPRPVRWRSNSAIITASASMLPAVRSPTAMPTRSGMPSGSPVTDMSPVMPWAIWSSPGRSRYGPSWPKPLMLP